MRTTGLALLILSLLGVLLFASIAPSAEIAPIPFSPVQFGPTRVSRLHDMPADTAFAIENGLHRWFVIELDAGTDVPALCERLSADPAVEYALPNWRLYPDAVPIGAAASFRGRIRAWSVGVPEPRRRWLTYCRYPRLLSRLMLSSV